MTATPPGCASMQKDIFSAGLFPFLLRRRHLLASSQAAYFSRNTMLFDTICFLRRFLFLPRVASRVFLGATSTLDRSQEPSGDLVGVSNHVGTCLSLWLEVACYELPSLLADVEQDLFDSVQGFFGFLACDAFHSECLDSVVIDLLRRRLGALQPLEEG